MSRSSPQARQFKAMQRNLAHMADERPVTCEIRYKLDMTKLPEFEAYARAWIVLTERHGGIHHGYFVPRPAPDGARMSFPQIGSKGPADVAVALFSFPDAESYRRYERLFLARVEA